MEQVINEIKSIQGVTGAFVYSAKGYVMANNLPPFFKETKVLAIGKVLSKIYSASNMTYTDTSEVMLAYEELYVIVREIVPRTYLVILCEPTLNVNLVTLSTNLIMDELKGIVESIPEPVLVPKSSATPATQSAPEPAAQAPGKPVARNVPEPPPIPAAPVHDPEPIAKKFSAKELLESSSISSNLKSMQNALAKVMGPMAKIIFVEALDNWQNACNPSVENLSKLLDILTLEIKEPDKMERYQEMVLPYLKD